MTVVDDDDAAPLAPTVDVANRVVEPAAPVTKPVETAVKLTVMTTVAPLLGSTLLMVSTEANGAVTSDEGAAPDAEPGPLPPVVTSVVVADPLPRIGLCVPVQMSPAHALAGSLVSTPGADALKGALTSGSEREMEPGPLVVRAELEMVEVRLGAG